MTTIADRRTPRPTVAELAGEIADVASDLPLFLTAPLYRRWHLRWGATAAEVASALPGDDLCARAQFGCTGAVTIDAPPQAVWPWLVQVGCQGRLLQQRPAGQSRNPQRSRDPPGIPASRDRPMGVDGPHSHRGDGLQGEQLRGESLVAMAQTGQHLGLDIDRHRLRPHPFGHSGASVL